jgi:maltose/moltooligosaccharide transporter
MKFNYGKIFVIGFGSFGFSLVWIIYNSFVPLFLENKFALPPAAIGFFMTLDNIAALFIQPAVGAYSDRLRTRLGRRLPFVALGAPVAAAAFGLIPLAGVLPLFVACTMTLLFSMALWRTPVVALMSDVTPSPNRSQANGITNFMGGLGGIIGSLGGAALFKLNPAYPFWMGCGLMLAAAVTLLLFVREPRDYGGASEQDPSLVGSLKAIAASREKSTLFMLLAILTGYLAYNAIEAFFTLYAENHLKLAGGDGANLLGQFVVALVVFAIPSGWVGSRLGRRNTILAGYGILAGVLLTVFLLPADQLRVALASSVPGLGTIRVVGALLMVGGAAWALVNVNVLPMMVDMTDNRSIGTYTGIYYISYTLAAIIGPNLNGWIVQLSGNYNLIMLSSAGFFGLALVFMLGVRRGEARK